MPVQRTTEAPRFTFALAALLLVSASACQHVAPYERGRLAHPTMVSSDLTTTGDQHLRSVQEGAIGGGTGAESGCGCN
jgi:Domain of unknown function (DUF4266)